MARTLRTTCKAAALLLLAALPWCATPAQQLVQRGAFGKPAQVLDETGEWTTPLLVASDPDVQIYIPDVSSTAWLAQNYRSFQDRGNYTLTMFTFYRTPKACRKSQVGWGLGDKAHLDACAITIAYRVRRATVDLGQKAVTLQLAAMLDQAGSVDPSSLQDKGGFRTWDQLDPNTQTALHKANTLVAEQMAKYDARLRSAQ